MQYNFKGCVVSTVAVLLATVGPQK